MQQNNPEDLDEKIPILCSCCGKEFEGIGLFFNPIRFLISRPYTNCHHCGQRYEYHFSWITWLCVLILLGICLLRLESIWG